MCQNLDFLEVSVHNAVIVGLLLVVCASIGAGLCACSLLGSSGSLIHLLKDMAQLILLCLDLIDGTGLNSGLEVGQLCLSFALHVSGHLVAVLLQHLLSLEHHLISAVADIDLFTLLLIIGSKLLSFLHSLVDILLGHIGGSGDGIAPAPRGVPQIEVTFDIDANGIVKVSAKDLGTGKEQNITITASTNMSKEDIDKAVKEAEQFAADDKKKREEVDIRNGADQMVFQTEKMLKENGDKLPAEVKTEAEAKLADLKTAVQSGNVDDIKAKQEALSQVFEKMYQAAAAAQQAAGAQPGPDAGANNQQKPGDDGVVDADFKEV